MLRDKLLTCTLCGNQFAYTVGQQRMALQEGLSLEDPHYCPLCEVKMIRGVREQPTRALPAEKPFASASVVPEADSAAHAPPAELRAPSPNRPSDYQSGEAHPLHGQGGSPMLGYVKWFNDRKGFGFLILDNGIELFVHYSGIVSDGYRSLKQGQRVSLIVEDTGKGPQASNVQVVPADERSDEVALSSQ